MASDNDLNAAEMGYVQWEAELQLRIQSVQADNPGYDEYRVNAGDIGHNVYELLSYLTAVYHDFSYAGIMPDLISLFGRQYELSFIPSVEIRTRTVRKTGSRSVTDPVTGEEHDENYTYSEDEEYEWHVLTVTLIAHSFSDVISPLMNQEQKGHFDMIMTKRGGRQYSDNPLGFNWLYAVTKPYGYYIGDGSEGFSDGITVSIPAGSDVFAGFTGSVTDAGEDFILLTNKNGVSVRYGNLSEVKAAVNDAVNPGAVIGVTGSSLRINANNSSGSLNPLIFMETGDTGAADIHYGDSGEPMSEATYSALMAEAQKHLGKPYVFGASGPDAFDCSLRT
jgi:hypothetical protein